MLRFAPLLLLLACDPEVEPPTITLLSPTTGSIVCGRPMLVEVEVTGFNLVEPFDGQQHPKGSGHVDSFLNGQPGSMSGQESFEVHGVLDGLWILEVMLVNDDHSSLIPAVTDTAEFTVESAPCTE